MRQEGCEFCLDSQKGDMTMCEYAMSSVPMSGGHLIVDVEHKPVEHCDGRGPPVYSSQDDRWHCPCGHSAECDDVMSAVSKWKLMFNEDDIGPHVLHLGIDMLLRGLDSDLWV